MFAWSRTWYCKKDNKYYNLEMKKQRDLLCKEYGFEKVPAVEAYEHYPCEQIEWRRFERFCERISKEMNHTLELNTAEAILIIGALDGRIPVGRERMLCDDLRTRIEGTIISGIVEEKHENNQ